MNKQTLRMLMWMTSMSYIEVAEILGISDRRLLSQTAKKSTYQKLSRDEVDIIIDIARNAPAVCRNKMLLKCIMVANELRHQDLSKNIRFALRCKNKKSIVAVNRALGVIEQQCGREAIERGQILMQSVERVLLC